MKSKIITLVLFIFFVSCAKKEDAPTLNIVFLHHSTGDLIWKGQPPSLLNRAVGKISSDMADRISKKPQLVRMIKNYNNITNNRYQIISQTYPKTAPYGWSNYPYDYYNIWVKHAGEESYMEEPTLEMLTQKYQVIIFKHCFPVSNIKADKETGDINSSERTIENYKLQYYALRNKLNTFPNTKFILFTGAAQVRNNITKDEALRAKEFFTWVIEEWDLPDDNIYLWDLYGLQTEGSLYFQDDYAASPIDSHPNKSFSRRVGKLLFNRIVDVIENEGANTYLTGSYK